MFSTSDQMVFVFICASLAGLLAYSAKFAAKNPQKAVGVFKLFQSFFGK